MRKFLRRTLYAVGVANAALVVVALTRHRDPIANKRLLLMRKPISYQECLDFMIELYQHDYLSREAEK